MIMAANEAQSVGSGYKFTGNTFFYGQSTATDQESTSEGEWTDSEYAYLGPAAEIASSSDLDV